MHIRWTKSLAIGIDEIDSQHRDLFEQMGRLLDASLEEEGLEAIEKIVIFLEKYIHDHFASEEGYMKRFDYPGYAAHKFAHDGFIASFKFLKEHLISDDNATVAVIDTEQLLSNWWLKHIRIEDKALGEFLLEKL